MCLPGLVGIIIRVVEVEDRIGKGVLPRIPVVIRRALPWEALSVSFDQEPCEISHMPASDIGANLLVGPSDRSTEAS